MSYNIVTYCSKGYLPKLYKTINSWSSQPSVENIYIYTDYEIENQISNKIIYKNIFELSECFGINCARKAESLQHFLNNEENIKNILMLDIDCMIIKDINDLFKEDFNIAITIYPEVKEKYRLKNISSGFVALKNCNFIKDFINQWVERQKNLHNSPSRDQRALSELIESLYKNKNDIYKIKLLNGNIFNSHPYNSGVGYVKEWLHRIKIYQPYVLHFASNTIINNQIIDDALMAMDNERE